MLAMGIQHENHEAAADMLPASNLPFQRTRAVPEPKQCDMQTHWWTI